MTFAAEIVGAALGPIPFGIVYDALGGYDVAIMGLLVLPVAATIAVLFATPPRGADGAASRHNHCSTR